MKPVEMPVELDERMKCKIHEANMNLMDGQHHQWCVALSLKGCFIIAKYWDPSGSPRDYDETG